MRGRQSAPSVRWCWPRDFLSEGPRTEKGRLSRSRLRLGHAAHLHRVTAQLLEPYVRPQVGLPFGVIERCPCQETYKPLRLDISQCRDQRTYALDLELFICDHGSVLLTKAV